MDTPSASRDEAGSLYGVWIVDGKVTDRPDETKARADAPAGDAVPRLQKCKVHTARLHLAFQTRSKKLEPLSIWAILQLKQLASSSASGAANAFFII